MGTSVIDMYKHKCFCTYIWLIMILFDGIFSCEPIRIRYYYRCTKTGHMILYMPEFKETFWTSNKSITVLSVTYNEMIQRYLLILSDNLNFE